MPSMPIKTLQVPHNYAGLQALANTLFTLSQVTHNAMLSNSVSSCLHYCSKLWANLSSRLHTLNNNVQKQARKYLLFGIYLKLKQLKAPKRRTRQKKLYNSIALMFLLVGASWQGIINAPIEQTSWSLSKYVCTL